MIAAIQCHKAADLHIISPTVDVTATYPREESTDEPRSTLPINLVDPASPPIDALTIPRVDAFLYSRIGRRIRRQGGHIHAMLAGEDAGVSRELEASCDRARDLWVDGRTDEATAIWMEAAAHGSARAQYNLGVVSREQNDPAQAIHWFERSATASPPYPDAVHALSIMLTESDPLRSAGLAEQAASLGVAAAAFNRGQMAKWADDYATASVWWRRAADLGDGEAAYNLAIQLDNDGDPQAARAMFWRSGELGYPDGMNNVAVYLRRAGDDSEAQEWFTRAAEAGSTLAMRNLAEIAEEEGQRSSAIAWLQRAADHGDAIAASRLRYLTVAPVTLDTAANRERRAFSAADFSGPDPGAPEQTQSAGFCSQCGEPSHFEGAFCTNCGEPYATADRSSTAVAEGDHYLVELVSPGTRSVAVMTAIRSFTDLGLAETKALVSAAPMVVGRFTSDVRAEQAKAKLEAAGATAHVIAPINLPEPSRVTGFRVILEDPGTNMMAVIKEVRSATAMGLVESKALVTSAPCTIATFDHQETAERVASTLTGLGATVRVER